MSHKIDVFGRKFGPNTSTFVDSLLLIFCYGGSINKFNIVIIHFIIPLLVYYYWDLIGKTITQAKPMLM